MGGRLLKKDAEILMLNKLMEKQIYKTRKNSLLLRRFFYGLNLIPFLSPLYD